MTQENYYFNINIAFHESFYKAMVFITLINIHSIIGEWTDHNI